MIELVSVEVKDFRSLGQATFTPLGIGQGMTAINGANGAGKSSIVHALIWALYGITPDGVPVKALRRQNSSGDVEVKVTFRHGGQTVEVVRALRGRNDSTVASISVDGIQQTNVSSRTATKWIEERLALDADGFLVAFVVRQKELDLLVQARPAERRKIIERLAGIERMSDAVVKARSVARDAAVLFEALPAAIDPAVAELAANQAAEAVEVARQSLEGASTAAEDAETASRAAATALLDARTVHDGAGYAILAVGHAEEAYETTQREVERLTAAAEGADDLEPAQAAGEDAREALSAAQALAGNVAGMRTRAEEARARADRSTRTAQRAERDASEAERNLDALETTLAALTPISDSEVAAAEAAVTQLTEMLGGNDRERRRLQQATALLRENHDHATCPTCEQAIQNTDALLALLQQQLAELTQERSEYAENLTKATETHQALRVEQERQRTLRLEVENARSAAARLRDAATAAAETADADEETAEVLEETAANAEATVAGTDLETLKAAYGAAQERWRKASSAVAAAKDLANATSALATKQEALVKARTKAEAAERELASVNLEAAQAAAAAAEQAANQQREHLASTRTALALAERDHADAQQNWETARSAHASRVAALAEKERTTAVVATLEEFRRDRLARLTPELSEVASDFIARMTDGRYPAMILDEEFTPVLVDAAGTERPVSWLSGGEESAVALALRVAVGEVIAGQRGGLLILDEVLTAQDAARRQTTMTAIRALPRQVITINHVSEATDMVDLVVQVIPGEDGSTITEQAPVTPLFDEAS